MKTKYSGINLKKISLTRLSRQGGELTNEKEKSDVCSDFFLGALDLPMGARRYTQRAQVPPPKREWPP